MLKAALAGSTYLLTEVQVLTGASSGGECNRWEQERQCERQARAQKHIGPFRRSLCRLDGTVLWRWLHDTGINAERCGREHRALRWHDSCAAVMSQRGRHVERGRRGREGKEQSQHY